MNLTLAWRYLRGRGSRSLLTTLAVTFGVMLTFGLGGILPAMVEAFTHNLLAAAGKVDLTVTSAYNQPFGTAVVDKLLATPQVATVSPGVQRTVPLPRSADAPADALAHVLLVGVDVPTATAVRDFTVSDGRMLVTTDRNACVLNTDLAGQLGLSVGVPLPLRRPRRRPLQRVRRARHPAARRRRRARRRGRRSPRFRTCRGAGTGPPGASGYR